MEKSRENNCLRRKVSAQESMLGENTVFTQGVSLASFTEKWNFLVSGAQLVHFPATFCADSSEPLLRTLRESAELLSPEFLLPRARLAEVACPPKWSRNG